ncbi:MAG: hypothetical protein AAGI92_01345 [Pseudomonadota bacterium]
MKTLAGICLLATLPLCQINPSFAEECGAIIRTIMTDFSTGRPAVKHQSTTIFGGQETKNTSFSTGFNELLGLGADGKPQTLFHDGAFYMTEDGGASWGLARKYTDEERQKLRQDATTQVDNATGFRCEMNRNLDGKAVHYLAADYTLTSTGGAVTSEFWVGVADMFVWKTRNVFDMNGSEMIVEQVSEPAPNFVLPTP